MRVGGKCQSVQFRQFTHSQTVVHTMFCQAYSSIQHNSATSDQICSSYMCLVPLVKSNWPALLAIRTLLFTTIPREVGWHFLQSVALQHTHTHTHIHTLTRHADATAPPTGSGMVTTARAQNWVVLGAGRVTASECHSRLSALLPCAAPS